MDVAYISTPSALAGSVIGAATSTGMTWLTQRAQARSGQLAHEFTRREETLSGLHRRGIQDIRRCAREQRAKALGAQRSLFDDQPDAGVIRAARCRECRQAHADHHRRLLHSGTFTFFT
jgi:hypothetical protein